MSFKTILHSRYFRRVFAISGSLAISFGFIVGILQYSTIAPGIYPYIGAILGSIFLTIIHYFLNNLYKDTKSFYDMKIDLLRDRAMLNNNINYVLRDGDIHKLHFVRWRLRHENRLIDKMKAGFIEIEVKPKNYYIRSVFGEIIKMLENDDEYSTISNLDFWTEDELIEDANEPLPQFLRDNLNAVVQKSILIRRIILIYLPGVRSKEELKATQSFMSIINKFNYAYKELTPLDDTIDIESKDSFKSKLAARDRFRTFFYFTNEKIFSNDFPTPFAIIRNNESFKLSVLPIDIDHPDIKRHPKININFPYESNLNKFVIPYRRFCDLINQHNNDLRMKFTITGKSLLEIRGRVLSLQQVNEWLM